MNVYFSIQLAEGDASMIELARIERCLDCDVLTNTKLALIIAV
jgi:hypothetical protein